MPTVRLDYDDAYRTQFDAVILAWTELGGHPAVVLDQTCFYPTSGGQPHDLGLLGDQPVIDVALNEQGEVLHALAAVPTAGERGARIQGEIDWPRRYDHMQQHTGQHLLSQVLVEHFGYETLSVHFGAAASTVDLAVEAMDEAQMRQVEGLVQAKIYANLPLHTYFVDETELNALPLRKPPAVKGRIRIVEIERFDYSACGGTHVRQTGEIGPLKLIKQERVRGGTRLTFLSGWRALRDYDAKRQTLNEAAALFSTDTQQVPALIERLQAENKALRRTTATLQEALLHQRAQALLTESVVVGNTRVIAVVLPDTEPHALKTLAQLLQEHPQVVALLVGVQDGKATVLFARGSAVDLHVGNLLRQTLRRFGGGGGGRPDFAQGGGVDPAQAEAIIDAARTRAEQELSA